MLPAAQEAKGVLCLCLTLFTALRDEINDVGEYICHLSGRNPLLSDLETARDILGLVKKSGEYQVASAVVKQVGAAFGSTLLLPDKLGMRQESKRSIAVEIVV